MLVPISFSFSFSFRWFCIFCIAILVLSTVDDRTTVIAASSTNSNNRSDTNTATISTESSPLAHRLQPADSSVTDPLSLASASVSSLSSSFFGHSSVAEWMSRFSISFPWSFRSQTPQVKGVTIDTTNTESYFWKGFTSSTAMIIATEIGDKTFFIAAVLSMRNSRWMVFLGAMLALIAMTILSTLMGLVLPSILPKSYTHIIGGVLFLYFGFKLIHDSHALQEHKVSDELLEVEEELLKTSGKKDDQVHHSHSNDSDHQDLADLHFLQDEERGLPAVPQEKPQDPHVEEASHSHLTLPSDSGDILRENGGASHSSSLVSRSHKGRTMNPTILTPPSSYSHSYSHSHSNHKSNSHHSKLISVNHVFFQALMLTFLAEWGDRSQIATIALAAAHDPWGVTIGACFGHSLCTGLSVMGGRLLASRISEKSVTFWGGLIFLLFGFHSLFWE